MPSAAPRASARAPTNHHEYSCLVVHHTCGAMGSEGCSSRVLGGKRGKIAQVIQQHARLGAAKAQRAVSGF
jgi:hypothetical protein